MVKMVDKTKAWKKVASHYKHFKDVEMRDLFDNDAQRAEKFTINFDNMLFDYSKNRISERTMKHLFRLARDCGVEEMIQSMFRGDKINTTENRAVLHVALRHRGNTPIYVDGKDVMPQINTVLGKMRQFSEEVRLGKFKGQTGKRVTNIVNIGIGGCDLGSVMVCEAL